MNEKLEELLKDLQEHANTHCKNAIEKDSEWDLGCQNAYDYTISKLKIIMDLN